MNVAEWILVAILSLTLFVFLVLGIMVMLKLLDLSKDVKKVIDRGQDLADNANDVVSNVKGMTAFGRTVEMVVDDYVTPRVKRKLELNEIRHEEKEAKKAAKEAEKVKEDEKKKAEKK